MGFHRKFAHGTEKDAASSGTEPSFLRRLLDVFTQSNYGVSGIVDSSAYRGTATTYPSPAEAPPYRKEVPVEEPVPTPHPLPERKPQERMPWYRKPAVWAATGLGVLGIGAGVAAADAANAVSWPDYINKRPAIVQNGEMASLKTQIQPAISDPDAKAMIDELYQLNPDARTSLRDSGLLVIYAQDGDITDGELAGVKNWKSATNGFDNKNHRLAAAFVGDNPESVQFPVYLNTQVIPQIRANVADWMGIWYPDNPRARAAINQQWDNMYGIHQKGEIIRRLDSAAPPFFLPSSMLTTDMQERTCVQYLDPNGHMNPVKYGGTAPRSNLLDFLERNASYFPVRHGEIWVMVTDLDAPIKSGPYFYTPQFLIENKIEGMSIPSDWPIGASDSIRDSNILLEKGSKPTQQWLKVKANAMTLNRGQDECAVETGVSDLLTIGERGYRIQVQYPLSSVRPGAPWHGELGGELTPKDKQALYAVDSSSLFTAQLDNTEIWTPLWSRANRVEDNGSTEAFLEPPTATITGERVEIPISSKN